MTFAERALPLIARGVPVVPLKPKSKVAFLNNWTDLASTDMKKIIEWNELFEDANVASVALAQPGGTWFLDIDREGYTKTIEEQTGKKIMTYMVRSSPGKGHFYFRHTPKSIEMGNRQVSDAQGELWSARVEKRYVVGPLSVHPDTGRLYECIRDIEIAPAPDWLIDWCISQSIGKPDVPSDQPSWVSNAPDWVKKLDFLDGDDASVLEACPDISDGARNTTLTSVGGKLHSLGWSDENVEYVLQVINADRCHPGLEGREVITIAKSVCRYKVPGQIMLGGQPVGYSAAADRSLATSIKRVNPALDETQIKVLLQQVKTFGQNSSAVEVDQDDVDPMSAPSINYLPESCLTSTRFGDIYDSLLKPNGWPIELALPAMATVGSVIVPRIPITERKLVFGGDEMLNLYTALIAPVHSGKSQMIEWAAKSVGIFTEDKPEGDKFVNYFEVKYGSAEQMLKSLSKKQLNFLNKKVLVNPDEWANIFAKAAIPNATFPSTLTTMFYKQNSVNTLGGSGGGREIDLNASVSFIGGIVEDDFDFVFGAATLGGLYDRFLFGRAPEGFNWAYRPFPAEKIGHYTDWNMKPVRIDGSVYEVTRDWAKKYPAMGRVTEICQRIACIFAAVDGRGIVTGRDIEPLEQLALYQVGLRQTFKPNAGLTPDAQYSNAVIAWVNQYAKDWKGLSKLKQAVRRYEEKLGPVIAERSLLALGRTGKIDLWLNDGKNNPPSDYTSKSPKLGLVRRAK